VLVFEMKKLTIFTAFILFIVCIAVFDFKAKVSNTQKELAAINAQIQRNEQRLHTLRAEWAYLTQPANLKRLASRHLTALQEMPAERITLVSALPSGRNTATPLAVAATGTAKPQVALALNR
jgi:cell division protein FtsL